MNSARFCFFHFGLFWVVIFKGDGGGVQLKVSDFFIWILFGSWGISNFWRNQKILDRCQVLTCRSGYLCAHFQSRHLCRKMGPKNDFSKISGKFFWALGPPPLPIPLIWLFLSFFRISNLQHIQGTQFAHISARIFKIHPYFSKKKDGPYFPRLIS